MNRKTGNVIAAAFATALCAGTLAGCAASPPAAGTPSPGGTVTLPPATAVGGSGGGPTAPGVPQCTTANLAAAVSVVAGSQGAGHESLNLTLTDISGHSCTVYGYPGLQLRGEDSQDQPGATQATTVTWDPGVPKTLLTLADSGSASTTIQFDVDVPGAGEPTSGQCEPFSYYLAVIAPNNTTSTTARIGGPNATTGITVCEHGNLQVLAFVAGSTGPNQ